MTLDGTSSSLDLRRSNEQYPCGAAREFARRFFAEPREVGWSTFGERDPESGGYDGRFTLKDGHRIYEITGRPFDWAINLQPPLR